MMVSYGNEEGLEVSFLPQPGLGGLGHKPLWTGKSNVSQSSKVCQYFITHSPCSCEYPGGECVGSQGTWGDNIVNHGMGHRGSRANVRALPQVTHVIWDGLSSSLLHLHFPSVKWVRVPSMEHSPFCHHVSYKAAEEHATVTTFFCSEDRETYKPL